MDDEAVEEVFLQYAKRLTYHVTKAQLSIDVANIADATTLLAELESMRNAVRLSLSEAQVIAAQAGLEGYMSDNVDPEELLIWQTNSGNPCPSCQERAGWGARTWDEWEQDGTPGFAGTICQQNCKCNLVLSKK